MGPSSLECERMTERCAFRVAVSSYVDMRQYSFVLVASVFLLASCNTNDKDIREGMKSHAATICACQERDCAIAAFDTLVSYGQSVKDKRVKDVASVEKAIESAMEAAGECLGELIVDDKYALKTWEAIGLAEPTSGDGVLAGLKAITTDMCACDSMRCFAEQSDRLGGYAELLPGDLIDAEMLPQFEQTLAEVEPCLGKMLTAQFE